MDLLAVWYDSHVYLDESWKITKRYRSLSWDEVQSYHDIQNYFSNTVLSLPLFWLEDVSAIIVRILGLKEVEIDESLVFTTVSWIPFIPWETLQDKFHEWIYLSIDKQLRELWLPYKHSKWISLDPTNIKVWKIDNWLLELTITDLWSRVREFVKACNSSWIS